MILSVLCRKLFEGVNTLHYLQCHTWSHPQASLTQQGCSAGPVCHSHTQVDGGRGLMPTLTSPCPKHVGCWTHDKPLVLEVWSQRSQLHIHTASPPEALQVDLHGMSLALPVDQKVKMAQF